MSVTDSDADKRETSPAGRTLVGPIPAWSVWGLGAVGAAGGQAVVSDAPTSPPPAPALLCVWVCVYVHVTATCGLSGSV